MARGRPLSPASSAALYARRGGGPPPALRGMTFWLVMRRSCATPARRRQRAFGGGGVQVGKGGRARREGGAGGSEAGRAAAHSEGPTACPPEGSAVRRACSHASRLSQAAHEPSACPDGRSTAAEDSDTFPRGTGGALSREFQRESKGLRGHTKAGPGRAGGEDGGPRAGRRLHLRQGSRPPLQARKQVVPHSGRWRYREAPRARGPWTARGCGGGDEVRRAAQICGRPTGPSIGLRALMGQPGTPRWPPATPRRPPTQPLSPSSPVPRSRGAPISLAHRLPPPRCAPSHGSPHQTTLGFDAQRTR